MNNGIESGGGGHQWTWRFGISCESLAKRPAILKAKINV